MKTTFTIVVILCGFFAFTFLGFNAWCWLFAFWKAAPNWLASPNYWAFTGCWLLLAIIPLGLFGLNGTDQDAH